MDLQNTINGDLHHSKRISSNFDKEISLIKEKFVKTDYPLHFIDSLVSFRRADESFIISKSLFETKKPFISNEITYYKLNEN